MKQNEIKPIFNVGDFIINGDVTDDGKPEVFKIKKICDTWYDVENIHDGRKTIITFTQNNSCRLWSIKDAKDSDILASKSGKKIFSYSGRFDLRHRPCAYYGIYETYDGLILTKCAFGNFFTYEEVYPATKEQRNLLLAKMREADWSWNVNSKELETGGKNVVIFSNDKKKVEQETVEFEKDSTIVEHYWAIVKRAFLRGFKYGKRK